MCPICRTSRTSTTLPGGRRQDGPTKAISAAASTPPTMPRDANISASRDPEIDRRLKDGPDLVSANFVIPYPPGFPIMVPGQVITQETIDFMRKLDVKEIHGYDAAEGLEAGASRGAGEGGRGAAKKRHDAGALMSESRRYKPSRSRLVFFISPKQFGAVLFDHAVQCYCQSVERTMPEPLSTKIQRPQTCVCQLS